MDVIIPKTRPAEDKHWWSVIERNLRMGIGREKVLAEQRQRETARLEAMIPRKTVEGLGQLVAVIDPLVYLRHHLDRPGCWNDKTYGREFLRDNPQCRANRPEKKYY